MTCPKCGVTVPGARTQPPRTPVEHAHAQRFWLILAAVGAAVVALILGVAALTQGDDDEVVPSDGRDAKAEQACARVAVEGDLSAGSIQSLMDAYRAALTSSSPGLREAAAAGPGLSGELDRSERIRTWCAANP